MFEGTLLFIKEHHQLNYGNPNNYYSDSKSFNIRNVFDFQIQRELKTAKTNLQSQTLTAFDNFHNLITFCCKCSIS